MFAKDARDDDLAQALRSSPSYFKELKVWRAPLLAPELQCDWQFGGRWCMSDLAPAFVLRRALRAHSFTLNLALKEIPSPVATGRCTVHAWEVFLGRGKRPSRGVRAPARVVA